MKKPSKYSRQTDCKIPTVKPESVIIRCHNLYKKEHWHAGFTNWIFKEEC